MDEGKSLILARFFIISSWAAMGESLCYHCGLPIPPALALTVAIGGEARAVCCVGCQLICTVCWACECMRHTLRELVLGLLNEVCV